MHSIENTIRTSQALLVLCIGLHAILVAFGNITDYATNFVFVQHVMSMDTIFMGSALEYRAVDYPAAHTAAYVIIILLEMTTGLFCTAGSFQMARARKLNHRTYTDSKRIAIIGLTCGFVTWQFVFMSVGGEWFGMWMSHVWNGLNSAFRISMTILGVLIYIGIGPDAKP